MTEINLSKAVEANNETSPNLGPNLDSNKISKSFRTWGRVDQILNIIGGIGFFPFSIPGIVAGIKLNKAIENVDNVSQDAATQEFVEAVKEFHKWAVIKIITMFAGSLLFGILFGAIIFAAITSETNKIKTPPSTGYNTQQAIDGNRNSSYSPSKATTNAVDEAKAATSAFDINTPEGRFQKDANGVMTVTDKNGEVTTINNTDISNILSGLEQ